MVRQFIVSLCFLLSYICLCGQSRYTFVFLHKRTDKVELPEAELNKLMEGHLANISRLAQEGKILVAGPFSGGGGIFILSTPSKEEATQWLEDDPGIKAKRWNIEMLPFTFKRGAACHVSDSAEMVNYNFVRFIPRITKYNVKGSSHVLEEQDKYLEQLSLTGNVIVDGIFPDRNGGILIMKGEMDRAIIEKSPAVSATTLDFEIRELWVGKGSFCEE